MKIERYRLVNAAQDLTTVMQLSPPIDIGARYHDLMMEIDEAAGLLRQDDKLLPDTTLIVQLVDEMMGAKYGARNNIGMRGMPEEVCGNDEEDDDDNPFEDDEGNLVLPTLEELKEEYRDGHITIEDIRQFFPQPFRNQAIAVLIDFHIKAVDDLMSLLTQDAPAQALNNALKKL